MDRRSIITPSMMIQMSRKLATTGNNIAVTKSERPLDTWTKPNIIESILKMMATRPSA
ncbi:MAG: hypothetical protein IH840_16520 [Candidatus Heimdallarchaeota archaeon]|nr:hypothetical protein [Candidatus Heimdallarchaeota archaeon]